VEVKKYKPSFSGINFFTCIRHCLKQQEDKKELLSRSPLSYVLYPDDAESSALHKSLGESLLGRRILKFGETTGQITNEDHLDSIFSKFCIGK